MTKREIKLLKASKALCDYFSYHNRNVTQKQEWYVIDLKEVLEDHYKKEMQEVNYGNL